MMGGKSVVMILEAHMVGSHGAYRKPAPRYE